MFTLVELLVVIAIIGVLSSLLLGQLKNAVGSARKLVCLNNARTIMTGCIIYGSDYSDFFPFINEGRISWDDRVSVYLGGRDLTLAEQERDYWKNKWMLDTLICPNDSRQEDENDWPVKTYSIILDPETHLVPEGYSFMGKVNVATKLSVTYPGGPLPRKYKSVQQFSDVQSPSTTAVISEYDLWLNRQGDGSNDHNFIRLDRQNEWGRTYLLHDFNVSYLFMDGHVEHLYMLDEKIYGTSTRLDHPKGIWTTDPND